MYCALKPFRITASVIMQDKRVLPVPTPPARNPDAPLAKTVLKFFAYLRVVLMALAASGFVIISRSPNRFPRYRAGILLKYLAVSGLYVF